jgi:hypothetical protein
VVCRQQQWLIGAIIDREDRNVSPEIGLILRIRLNQKALRRVVMVLLIEGIKADSFHEIRHLIQRRFFLEAAVGPKEMSRGKDIALITILQFCEASGTSGLRSSRRIKFRAADECLVEIRRPCRRWRSGLRIPWG